MIGQVVQAVSCEMLETLKKVDSDIRTINYQYGPAAQLKETLKQFDEDRSKCYEKYPLIFLVTPFVEKEGDGPGSYRRAMPKIGIAHHTTDDLKSSERYERSFRKVLLPLYDCFIEQLLASGYFPVRSERDLKLSRSIRDDIGRRPFLNISGASSDYIDGIEITNIELPIIQTSCCMSGDFH
ncbi:hypothetical protein JST56_07240 [Candidatus Dependentiae bacterium]|nr:hypothetical protein [Candidatus Dependentiae bacterium]